MFADASTETIKKKEKPNDVTELIIKIERPPPVQIIELCAECKTARQNFTTVIIIF